MHRVGMCSLYGCPMHELVDITPTPPDLVPEPIPYQFDLTPTSWTSELIDLYEHGRIGAPWVSWHKDQKTVLVLVDATEGMTVAVRLVPRGEEWEAENISISRPLHADIVSEADLKGLGAVLGRCRDMATRFIEMTEGIDRLLEPWRTSARGAVARRSEVAYAALAARYVELVERGERHPGKVLGESLGMSPVTLAQRVREARSEPLGLLTPATQGRAGGFLTDKAKRLLIEAASTN